MKNIDALTHYYNIFSTMRSVHYLEKPLSEEEEAKKLKSIESSIIELEKESLWFPLKDEKEIIKYFNCSIAQYCSIFNYHVSDFACSYNSEIYERQTNAIDEQCHFFAIPLYIDIGCATQTNLKFSVALIDIFLNHGFDINSVWPDSREEEKTILYDALLCGNLDYAKALITRGANPLQEIDFIGGKMKVADNLIQEMMMDNSQKNDPDSIESSIKSIEYLKALKCAIEEKTELGIAVQASVKNKSIKKSKQLNQANKL